MDEIMAEALSLSPNGTSWMEETEDAKHRLGK